MAYDDWFEDEKVKEIFFPELRKLLEDFFGTPHIQIFEYRIRRRSRTFPVSTGNTLDWAQPVSTAHVDFNLTEIKKVVQYHNGSKAEGFLKHHYRCINVWKPLRGPVRDWPLALCDAKTINAANDLVTADVVYQDHAEENLQIHYSPEQRWLYLSDQQPSEMLIFRCADSLQEPVRPALGPIIVEICRLSGTPGVSLGVLYKNEIVHVDNFGYRDVKGIVPPDDNTLYYFASLSKAFTAACIGILVDEKKLKWDTPVSRILPDFAHPDPTISEKAGMLDFLSHRTGLASKNQMWLTDMGQLSLPRDETVRFSSYLEVVPDFQTRWLYNNWGYGLADEVTEKLAGKSWGEFLRERVFDPLGMKRTTTNHSPDTANVAKAYMALADETP